MLEGKYLMFGDPLDDIMKVRVLVNGVGTQDSMDTEAIHVIVYEDNVAVAIGRLLMINDVYLLDGIQVVPERRHNKIGDFVVRLLVEKANLLSAKVVYVLCNATSRGFFENMGFFENKNQLENVRKELQKELQEELQKELQKDVKNQDCYNSDCYNEQLICMELDVVGFKSNHKCCK